jgi:hypothetical protein
LTWADELRHAELPDVWSPSALDELPPDELPCDGLSSAPGEPSPGDE